MDHKTQPETGTLAELNLKPGDVVECVNRVYYKGLHWTCYEKHPKGYCDRLCVCFRDGDRSGYLRVKNTCDWKFRIVSRASQPDTPKLLRDMTDAEIGALVRAHNEGKVVEWFIPESAVWARASNPSWAEGLAYRVRPEPKRETQRIVWTPLGRDGHAFHSGEAEVGDWVIAFETEQTEDGLRPVPATLKFEEHF